MTVVNGKRKKILWIKSNSGNKGGVTELFSILLPRMDREKYDIRILSVYQRGEAGTYSLRMKKGDGFSKIRRRLAQFLRKDRYDIIHINAGSRRLNMNLCREIRKETDAKLIVHSHNSIPEKWWKKAVSGQTKRYIGRAADYRLACSKEAGRSMFPKGVDFEVLPNGIDFTGFLFTPEKREAARQALLAEIGRPETAPANNENTEEPVIVGHAGRFVAQKNHAFLLRFFKLFHEAYEKPSILILAGTGEKMEEMRQLAKELGIEDCVYFLGARSDMPALYAAMDLFVLPSKYEGFGLVVAEAQAGGVPALVSDGVPAEAIMEGTPVRKLPLSAGEDAWCKAAGELLGEKRERVGKKDPRLDIDHMAGRLEAIYEELLNTGS